MTHDNVLDRIDDVLAGGDTAIDDDWSVSGDAMRSRPATEGDPEFGAPRTFGTIRAVAFVPHIADPTAPTVAELEGGIDLTQHFASDGAGGMFFHPDGLPEPRPNLRLQVIDALGLMPVLTRLVTWLSAALERIQPVLDRVDPRPAARRRRWNARQPSHTLTVTFDIDTTAFAEAMHRMSAAMSGIGRTAASAGTHLTAVAQRMLELDVEEVAAECHRMDLADMRYLARRELAGARAWLDRHVSTVYADLGLEPMP